MTVNVISIGTWNKSLEFAECLKKSFFCSSKTVYARKNKTGTASFLSILEEGEQSAKKQTNRQTNKQTNKQTGNQI